MGRGVVMVGMADESLFWIVCLAQAAEVLGRGRSWAAWTGGRGRGKREEEKGGVADHSSGF